jgi:hypothetical protein
MRQLCHLVALDDFAPRRRMVAGGTVAACEYYRKWKRTNEMAKGFEMPKDVLRRMLRTLSRRALKCFYLRERTGQSSEIPDA